MKFFFDNNLAPRFAEALSALEANAHTITHLRESFAPDTRDVDWIKALASQRGG